MVKRRSPLFETRKNRKDPKKKREAILHLIFKIRASLSHLFWHVLPLPLEPALHTRCCDGSAPLCAVVALIFIHRHTASVEEEDDLSKMMMMMMMMMMTTLI
jgi:hypothetical protein